MQILKKCQTLFTNHPKSLNETYFNHLYCALKFGISMAIGGFACIIHAFIPFLFQHTASDFMFKMMHDFLARLPKPEERVVCLLEVIKDKVEKGR